MLDIVNPFNQLQTSSTIKYLWRGVWRVRKWQTRQASVRIQKIKNTHKIINSRRRNLNLSTGHSNVHLIRSWSCIALFGLGDTQLIRILFRLMCWIIMADTTLLNKRHRLPTAIMTKNFNGSLDYFHYPPIPFQFSMANNHITQHKWSNKPIWLYWE